MRGEQDKTSSRPAAGRRRQAVAGVHVLDLVRTSSETLIGMVPILAVLILFRVAVLRAPLSDWLQTAVGTVLAMLGLVLFIHGLRIAVLPLAEGIGLELPARGSLWLLMGFTLIVGYGATLAEPALIALAMQVEELTAGRLSQPLIVHTVAAGVAVGLTAGALKIIFQIPNTNIILPVLVLMALLVYFAPEEVTGLAFDAALATTGPVTVPITVSLGVGIATALGGRDPLLDGFGVVTLAALGPMMALLLVGIVYRA
ncbi:MAG TPA: DUF1538 domain-containing protein [Limnochordia bacterium]